MGRFGGLVLRSIFIASLLTLFIVPTHLVFAGSTYDSLYPYYGEICAVSKISKKVGVKGGKGGHGALYLRGACRDLSSPYPKIKMCDNAAMQVSDQAGVGVSIDSIFKNVNWVAVESQDFFFKGGVAEDAPLNQENYERAFHEVKDRQILRGVKYQEEFLKKKQPDETDEQAAIHEMLGTDFALNFGRHAYCVRVPLNRSMVEIMVNYLNEQNEKYITTENYRWDGIDDNCTHPIVNAFSKAGLWDSIETNRAALIQLFNLAIPSNEFIRAAMHGNDRDLDDPLELFNDEWDRGLIIDQGRLATRHGYITRYVPPHQFQNELYNVVNEILVLNFPLLGPNERRLTRLSTEPRYTDIAANLTWFIEKYEAALKDKSSLKSIFKQAAGDREIRRPGLPLDSDQISSFYSRYEELLTEHLADAKAQLVQVKELESQSENHLVLP